jgi:hypothetical protein
MPVAFQCRWCKGPPLPQPWEGACPNCLGFYRPIQIYVRGPTGASCHPACAAALRPDGFTEMVNIMTIVPMH